MNLNRRIILASQSKSRRRALEILGLSYDCIPANIDEKAIRDTNPLKMAVMISEAKARAVAEQEQGVIIAADAFLVLQGKVLEKPHSLEEAYAMLEALSGKQHMFVTGLAVYDTIHQKMRSTVTTCNRHFRSIERYEIEDYCSRYSVLDYAGAHEADGVVRFAEHIEGSCNTETAIPMKELISFLKEIAKEPNK